MYALLVIGLSGAAILLLVILARNANLLFEAVIRDGRIISVRGRLPKRLEHDLEDVARLRPVHHARVRADLSDRRPMLQATGDVEPNELQRMRNVLGMWDLAKIRAAPYRSR